MLVREENFFFPSRYRVLGERCGEGGREPAPERGKRKAPGLVSWALE